MKKTKHFNISVPELGDVPDITQVSNAISDLEDATAGTLEIMKAEMQGTKITLTSVSRKTKRTGYYEGMSIRFKSPQDIEPNYLKTISVDGLGDQELSVAYKVNRNEYIDIVYEGNKFTAYDGKVSKSGDTMTGTLAIDKKDNPALALEVSGERKSTYGYVNDNVYIDNKTSGAQIAMYDNGNTTITAKNLSTQSKEVVSAINELNSKKSDLTGSTFTGLVEVKKDTNGEAMVALNSAYGNGDIYSGGSYKGVGFKNRTSGAGLFLDDTNNISISSSQLFIKENQLVYRNTGTTAQYIPHVKTFRIHDTKIQGIIKISFKNGFDSTMMDFVVNIFNYQGTSGKVYISGYNYDTCKEWSYNDSNMIYSDNSIDRAVYFGKENDIPVIYIGNKNEKYSYPTVTIGEMVIHSRVDSKNFLDNIDIEIVNDFASNFTNDSTKKSSILNNNNIIDNLLSTDTDKPLSANQGKRLSDEKLDKTGGKVTGSITVDVDTNNNIILYKNGELKGIVTTGSQYVGMYNSTSKKAFQLNDDGGAILQATNLTTKSKEVVSAINEIFSKNKSGSTDVGYWEKDTITGKIIQFGHVRDGVHKFPIPFSTENFTMLTSYDHDGTLTLSSIKRIDNATFKITTNASGGRIAKVYWFAIGY